MGLPRTTTTNVISLEDSVVSSERFGFGENWRQFLEHLNDERIEQAEQSLCKMLQVKDLKGKTFLDVGSGSGLFSLVARRLGAKVRSFDYDPQSVACTAELKRRYFANDKDWTVERGSAIDETYMASLGAYDVVYSWGVLHHTGGMWKGLELIDQCVKPKGKLFIALYNDQGGASRRWLKKKKIYNRLPDALKTPFAALVYAYPEAKTLLSHTLKGEFFLYFKNIIHYGALTGRGMSWWHDRIDWIGGLPFEVANPGEIFTYYRDRGYSMSALTTVGGTNACNEFVFCKDA